MARAPSLNTPHPHHIPTVTQDKSGDRTGTRMTCDCGTYQGRVSDSAPGSTQGRSDTRKAYKRHVGGLSL